MMIFAAAPDTLPGAVTLIQLGFVGVALLWFVMGKVHSDSEVKDLKEQLSIRDKIIADERADSKAVRDAVIKDVAPLLARVADRDKEVTELVTRLLAWQISQDGKK